MDPHDVLVHRVAGGAQALGFEFRTEVALDARSRADVVVYEPVPLRESEAWTLSAPGQVVAVVEVKPELRTPGQINSAIAQARRYGAAARCPAWAVAGCWSAISRGYRSYGGDVHLGSLDDLFAWLWGLQSTEAVAS